MLNLQARPNTRRPRHRGTRARPWHAAAAAIGHYALADLLVAQVVPLASAMTVTLTTARLLGTSGRGLLTFVVSASSLVGAVLQASLHVGAAHAYRRGEQQALAGGLHLAGLFAAGLVAVGVAQFLLAPRYRLGLVDRGSLLVVCCGAAAFVVNLYATRTLQALGETKAYRRVLVIQSLVYFCAGIATAAVWRRPAPVIAAWAVAIVVSTALALHGLRSVPRSSAPARPGLKRRVLRSSLAAHVGVTGQQMLFRADVVVLGLVATAHAVGIYSVATTVAGLVWVVSEALALAAFAEGRTALSGPDRRQRRHELLRLNLMGSVVGAVVIACVTVPVLPAALPGYQEAVPLVLILLPGVVLSGSARIALSSLVADDAQRLVVRAGVLATLISSLYVPLVVAWHATGAAIASSLVYLAQWLIVRRLARQGEAMVHG